MSSYTEIDDRIREAEQELHRIINSEKRLVIIKNEIDIVTHDLTVQKQKMKSELADVERLEKKGVHNLFTKVLGDIEKQIEKERQEYLQEVLCYNSLIDQLEVLEYEQGILKKKVALKLEIEKRYQLLIDEKEKYLKLNFPKLANELKKIDDQITVQHYILKETEEAIVSGKDLLDHLQQMINYLQYVNQWGIFLTRGQRRYSTHEKKGYIDKAQKLVGTIQVKFNMFEKELRDLYPDFDLNLQSYSLNSFIDNFYDGLITDWIVVKNLQIAMNSTVGASHKVQRLMSMITSEDEKIKKRLTENKSERIQYLKGIDLTKINQ